MAVLLAGCSSFSGSDGAGAGPLGSGGGPEVRILAPIGGQSIAGSVVRVQVQVRGVRLVNKLGEPNVSGEGHLRVWVDTEDPSAPFMVQTATAFDLNGLQPGLHHLVVELCQNDGTPFPGASTHEEEQTPVLKHTHFEIVPALSRIQSEIFTPSCAVAGCHVSGGDAPMPLTDARTSYEALVDAVPTNSAARAAGKKRAVPLRPDQSFLLQKLMRDLQFGEGDPMPQNAPPLTQAQIDLIRAWIEQGAVPVP
jgi:hypothetical protein